MAAPPLVISGLEWLTDAGVPDQHDLNPCVPGEFTFAHTYYVNTATPKIVYEGTGEGTLPLVAGRWFLIPDDVLDRAPQLKNDAVSVARAVRLARRA